MRDALIPLISALISARHFEDAAHSVLTQALHVAVDTLGSSRFAGQGRIMRAMVQLRLEDGYRRLVILEESAETVATHESRRPVRHGERRPKAPGGRGVGDSAPAFLPSATAWRWVSEHRCPVSIDVNTGQVKTYVDGSSVVVQEQGQSAAFDSKESVQRLLSREASHVYCIPLHSTTGTVEGMISLEGDCRPAISHDFIWPDCGDRLNLLAAVAAPYLVSLPPRPAKAASDDFLPVVGPSMAGTVELLRVFAGQDETILLSGPTGSGKSRLAQWCHQQSPRRNRSFESIDLMTVPEELRQGELFGWTKGAFTSAVKDNAGCLGRAEGGTLFIDEIDKVSLSVQASLLRVLAERRYRPIGEGTGERTADVRFLIGTNTDLRAAVRAGRFLEDLYFRIHVLAVKIPPLEERADEIPSWAHFFINRRHRERVPSGEARLTPEAEKILAQARWPGNLRQLDSIMRRAYAMALLDVGGGSPKEMVLEGRHVKRSLECEPAGDGAPLTALLRAAAAAFVGEAERLAPSGGLDLDLAKTFRGFVLGTAVRKLGSKDDAFRLLNRASYVDKGRNHHRFLKRELKELQKLFDALGEAGMPFADLLEGDAESTD